MKNIIISLFLLLNLSFGDENLSIKNLKINTKTEQNVSIQKNVQKNIIGEPNGTAMTKQNLNPKLTDEKIQFSFASLYKNAHIAVKIVIYILCLFSVLTWTIFFYKFIHFVILFRQARLDRIILNQTKTLPNNLSKKSISKDFVEHINNEIEKSNIQDENLRQRIDDRLSLQINDLLFNSKKGISPLATISSSAPFIGLFGTVWGIMNSFIGIANAKSTSLNVVAPGIAEALFATALGLIAAIPAVILFNYFTKLSTKYSVLVTQIANELLIIANRDISYKKQG